MLMVFLAERMASSMAGNMCSPLTRVVIALPSTIGGARQGAAGGGELGGGTGKRMPVPGGRMGGPGKQAAERVYNRWTEPAGTSGVQNGCAGRGLRRFSSEGSLRLRRGGRREMDMFERFTDRARKVMALANQEAQRFNHEYIGTEHILLGLVKEGSGVGANVLKNLDVDLRKVRLEVEKLVKSGPDMVTMGKLPQTPRAKKVIEYAIEEARSLNHNYVGTEHLLLGLLREHDGVAAQVLMNLGLKLEEVREEVLNLLGAGVESEEQATPEKQGAKGKSKTPALDSFGRDLTELAKEGS